MTHVCLPYRQTSHFISCLSAIYIIHGLARHKYFFKVKLAKVVIVEHMAAAGMHYYMFTDALDAINILIMKMAIGGH